MKWLKMLCGKNRNNDRSASSKNDGKVVILLVCLIFFSGCAVNKAKLKANVENEDFNYVLILKGNADDIAKCFVAYEKKNIKQAIKFERDIRSSITKSPVSRGRVYAGWDVTRLSRDGHEVTRVLCKEYESLVLDYRYTVDFMQVNPDEVRAEIYGRTYTSESGWHKMKCSEIVMDLNALEQACKNGNIKDVQQMIPRLSDHYSTDHVGFTAFKHAAENGHANIIKFLLEHGLSLHAENMESPKALREACKKGQLEIARLLLANGVDVNAKTRSGRSALRSAAVANHPDIMMLLENGGNANIANKSGKTALQYAEKNGKSKIRDLLLTHGANH